MIRQIEDGPPYAGGLLVAFVATEGEGPAVLVQAGTTRYTLDPADAKGMAAALELVAAIVEAGGPAPGTRLIPFDSTADVIAETIEFNKRVGRA